MTRFTQLTQAARRPWRRLRRLCRVVQGRDLWCGPEITLRTERHGSAYGGWTLWPEPLDPDAVVYSFGVGQDITFDLALIARFGCQVHAFDPTPRSADWVRRQPVPAAFHFYEYGLGAIDGIVRLAPPAHPRHVSYTLAPPGAAAARWEPFPVRRLTTIAAELKHDRIDLLKMDIEGSEYGALEDLERTDLRIGQILVEFHHRLDRGAVTRTRQSIQRLREAGFLLFDVSPAGEEYAFVNRSALDRSWKQANEHCANSQ